MVATYVYMAPYDLQSQTVLAHTVWTSPEILIPYTAHGFSISCKSDVDGALEIQKELNGAYEDFDSVPITGGATTHPVRVYNFRVPAVKMIFTPAGGVAAVISSRVDVTPAVEG